MAGLIAGGETVEYGAHLIPEGGKRHLPPAGIPGLLLVGDAAGFVLNTGITVRGMDLALASGVLAGRSIVETIRGKQDAETCLRLYRSKLKDSFIMKQLKAHKRAFGLLSLERFYRHYPRQIALWAQSLFEADRRGESLSIGKAVRKFGFGVLGWRGMRDLWWLVRM